MRHVVFSAAARRDLLDIWLYIVKDSIDAADRVRDEIRSAVKLLAEMPGLGHPRAEVKDTTLRFWSVYSYLIAYRYDDRTLNVVRIVHGARNLRRIFRGR